jgi:hypothetical protein
MYMRWIYVCTWSTLVHLRLCIKIYLFIGSVVDRGSFSSCGIDERAASLLLQQEDAGTGPILAEERMGLFDSGKDKREEEECRLVLACCVYITHTDPIYSGRKRCSRRDG